MSNRSPFSCVTLLLRFGFALWLVSIAAAQTSPDQDLTSLSIEQLTKTKVSSASRHSEETRDAPSAVSIVTSEDIARFGWRTLGDVLNSLRGFYTSYDRDYTYLGVRGVQRPGDYNSRILLLINGHRLNDNVYDSALIGTEFPLDLDLIDHIEIVRGPSSSLFGTNAIFGVINVITRQPKSDGYLEAAGDDGTFLTRSGRLTGMYERGNFSALLSGSLSRSHGQSSLFFPEFVADNGGVANNLDEERSDHAFADITYGGLRIQTLFGIRTKEIPTASFGADFDAPEQDTDSRGYVETSYHHTLSPTTDLDLRTYYDWYNYFGAGDFGIGSPGAVVGESFARADWSGIEGTIGKQIGEQRITLGADYEYSPEVAQKNYTVGQPGGLNVSESTWLAAAYGEAELHLARELVLHAGGRLDWFDTFGTALSPRAALVFQPSTRIALKYIFSRAFRAPNAYEDYYSDGVAIVAPVKPLNPENITSHEVVFEDNLRPWLGVMADGFYNDLTNLIDEVPDSTDGLNHFVNIGHNRSRGLSLELEIKRESGLSARASYTFANAADELQHARLANSPTHLVKLHGTIPMSRRAIAGLELLYTSEQISYQQTLVPSSALTNVTLSTKPMWRRWEFSASCYNAFNQRWFTPAGPGLQQSEIQQDGRTFRVKISYRLPFKEDRGK